MWHGLERFATASNVSAGPIRHWGSIGKELIAETERDEMIIMEKNKGIKT